MVVSTGRKGHLIQAEDTQSIKKERYLSIYKTYWKQLEGTPKKGKKSVGNKTFLRATPRKKKQSPFFFFFCNQYLGIVDNFSLYHALKCAADELTVYEAKRDKTWRRRDS